MTINELLILTLVILNVVDGFMTYNALEHRGKRKLNPIMRWVFDKLSIRFGVVLAKGGAVLAVCVIPLHFYVLLGLTIWYVGITINNIKHWKD